MLRNVFSETFVRCVLIVGFSAPFLAAQDWPEAAGPNRDFFSNGSAPGFFSVAQEKNVLWRAKLPSTGQGAPVVSGGRVFVTSHEPITGDTELGKDILGMCFDRETGKELWRRTIAGTRETDLSSLFSDNTAASPVADGERVCFVNVGGGIRCFDFAGNELWEYAWVPFGRHHARLHEPMLYDGCIITMQYPKNDLKAEHTTKPGAKPLGRDKKYWTQLQAFDLASGDRKWVANAGTSVHQTSSLQTRGGRGVILTGRGGGHQPPEEPFGLSLIAAENGETIWTTAIQKFPSAQNSVMNRERVFALSHQEHFTLDLKTGELLKRIPLRESVTQWSYGEDGWKKRANVSLPKVKHGYTKNSNILIGDYHYFRAGSDYNIGRVHVVTGAIEYLQVPIQVVRTLGKREELRWDKFQPNDMKNADGFVASQDRRNAGSGWGHVSAASPIVVGDLLYMPTMLGVVYVVRWNDEELTAESLISVSDLGPASETWSLSSLSYSDGRIYARTLKELICIGSDE